MTAGWGEKGKIKAETCFSKPGLGDIGISKRA
jgi:hypothetical protein